MVISSIFHLTGSHYITERKSFAYLYERSYRPTPGRIIAVDAPSMSTQNPLLLIVGAVTAEDCPDDEEEVIGVDSVAVDEVDSDVPD